MLIKLIIWQAMFCLLVGFMNNCAGPRRIYVRTPLFKKIVEVQKKPHEDAFCVAGHWNWNGHIYVLKDGHWIKQRKGYHWIPGQWKKDRRSWYWAECYWKRQ